MTSEIDDAERGQVTGSAAEVYEELFVPALFGRWAPVLLEAVGLRAGDRALDVGCGTGVVAREARRRGARVTGVDVNGGMLAVARRADPSVDWQQGAAEDLPVDDGSFDRITCSFALMFLEDRERAVAEMGRVLVPGGAVALTTWADVDRSPGYAAMVQLLDRLFGREAADALRAPFRLGDPAGLAAIVGTAFPDVVVEERSGVARFPSLDAWVRTDIKGWTLADVIDDDGLDRLLAEARTELAGFVAADGTVAFAAPALLAVASAEV